MESIFIEIVGWTGAFLVLLAYFLVSTEKLEGKGVLFQLLNLFGVIGLGINVFAHHAWPNLGLNIVWGFIAIFILYRIKFKSKSS